MKTKFFISILLLSVFCLQGRASVNVNKSMTNNGITYPLNYCLPSDFDSTKEYPLIVAMHYCGGSATQYRDALAALCDSLDMIVVCPDNKSQVIPESELSMLVTAIDSSKLFYPIDSAQVYLTGMSCNGEFITRHGLKNFYPFKGIFPWDPWITSTDPAVYNFDSKMPIVISVGSADPNYKALISFYDSLVAHKANVNLVIVPNVGHSLFADFSAEMVNCIYYLNGTPDFSFNPIDPIQILNNDSVSIDVVVNNPANKELKYFATVNNKVLVSTVEIIPGSDSNHFKLKVVPNSKRKGSLIITLKAFDQANQQMAQQFSTVEIKAAPVSSKPIGQANFKIYPVPVSDYLYFTGCEQNLSVNITDISGRVIINSENVDGRSGIQVQSLPRGFYYLNATGNQTDETVKFLKE